MIYGRIRLIRFCTRLWRALSGLVLQSRIGSLSFGDP